MNLEPVRIYTGTSIRVFEVDTVECKFCWRDRYGSGILSYMNVYFESGCGPLTGVMAGWCVKAEIHL